MEGRFIITNQPIKKKTAINDLQANTYRASGKLLLSGEYFVLDGALSLAVPTAFGQTLRVQPGGESGRLDWQSFDEQGRLWFRGTFTLPAIRYLEGSDDAAGRRLESLLAAVEAQRPGYWSDTAGLRVETHLDFPREWGLGSSSTLVSLIAQWTGADPYALLAASFGGSGYDLACALAPGPVLFQLADGHPRFVGIPFYPSFHRSLYFVYLGRKQDSRAGIARYRERPAHDKSLLEQVSRLTMAFCCAGNLDVFDELIRAHEELIAGALALPRAKDLYFPGFWGEVKSLGAWGGDFILLTSRRPEAETRNFLRARGFEVVFCYADLVKSQPVAQTK